MRKHLLPILLSVLLANCATYKPKYAEDDGKEDSPTTKEVEHTYYLIGDAGLSPLGGMNDALKQFKKRLSSAAENSTAIFLGDNIYPAGLPDKKDSTVAYILAKSHLEAQLGTLDSFPGRPLFIPGNHDWYTEGVKGLKRQEEYVERRIKKDQPFEPENGCPIETISYSDNTLVVIIDTYWYLTNWDKRPDINDECEIKTREAFFAELEDVIKKNRDKTTIIATHHPMFSYGVHGGQYTWRQQLYPKKMAIPLPLLGTLINVLRRTTGTSTEDMQHKRYLSLVKRLITLAQFSPKVVIASGHEHTLQYIVEDNTPQIVSGSGAKKGATRLLNGSKFSTGMMGYATLEVYTDGSSRIRYYGIDETGEEKFLYTTQVLPPDRSVNEDVFDTEFPEYVSASIYTPEETEVSGLHETLWGERYRKYYGTKVKAPTVLLDTLYGGLTPIRKGGGHQSKSLRLRHKSGKEYVMRALKKSAELYLQAIAFKEQYVIGDFEDTTIENIISDFYTGAHPYAPFTIGPLSEAVGLYHTNPKLFYVPRQPALEDFNASFGDELYMIEEHVSEGHGEYVGWSVSNKIEGTMDMLTTLREDEKYDVDSELYARARLFDMLIGDWDRHTDQWRWALYTDKESGKKIFKPIPRDRDQAFSNMGDGFVMGLGSKFIPGLRLFEGFNPEIKSVKGINSAPKTYMLDLYMLRETDLETWEKQARIIQEGITPEVIDRAMALFPEEVRDENIAKIKANILSRKAQLVNTAREFYKILNQYALVNGTDKDDYFTIASPEEGKTKVTVQRIIEGVPVKKFFEKTYYTDVTKEIWIYGLDDDDVFDVQGAQEIRLRIVGGQNNDVYKVENGRKVHLYDYKTKKNTFDEAGSSKIHRTDDYETNVFDISSIKTSTNQILPTLGVNPDDGIRIGFINTYTFNGFKKNPFTQRHIFGASFYFATSGIDLHYSGEFARVIGNTNLNLDARYTSPNFSINFFGLGNETTNPDDVIGLDYNRVKIEQLSFTPSLVWRGKFGSAFHLGAKVERIQVEDTANRFLVNEFLPANPLELDQDFFGANATYTYENIDNYSFPTMGMATSFSTGYVANLNGENSFGYLKPSLSIYYKIIPSGNLVLATKWDAHFLLGDEYQFYQAASIGGNDGLRGFRHQRFTGKTAYYQNTDLRLSFGRRNTGVFPVTTGIYGGFDYGRVWLPNEDSDTWHTSAGGGFFITAADLLTGNVALFNSADGIRFTFGLGFGF